ncbi:sensor protein FixL [Sphingomonas metalli]|uniref:histidine kinase n=1 Tax=Sphingomonas metalli TaxID=1779358 RepID=A0A916TCS5_9SPHN|nr:ATP-binding protein [Sphingomonas metalli]GGB40449.1 sensor protein FixL [Sphingomonas metalli]
MNDESGGRDRWQAAAAAACALSAAGFVEWDGSSRTVRFDARAAQIFDRPELAGHAVPLRGLRQLGLESLSLDRVEIRLILSGGGPERTMLTALRRTAAGQKCHLLISLCRLSTKPARVIAAVADRTNETRNHAELAATLRTVPSAMIVVDDGGAIQAFSATAEQMFGLTSEQALGAPVDILAPEHAPEDAAREGLVGLLRSGMPHMLGLSRHVYAMRSDGSAFPAEVWMGEATVDGERLTTAFVRDQTARFETEAKLQTLQHDLVHASRVSAMGELSLALAHELNQPLAAMVNHLSVAEFHLESLAGKAAESVRKSVDNASQQALRTGEIVKRLRAFVQRGEGDPAPEPIDRIVGEAISLLSTLARQRGIQLQVRLPGGHARVFADRIQIQQVLVNLMRNAIEALNRSGQTECLLSVLVERRGGDLLFSVEDNGPGVPDTLEPLLFSRFSTAKSDEGLGVGLSISRRIVEAHGSELKYRRGALGGAQFSFALPEHREQEHV